MSKLQWGEILILLNTRPEDLFNKSNKKYQNSLTDHDFEEDGWLEILRENPCMIKGPIATMNNRAVLYIKPRVIYRLLPDHKLHEILK